MYYYYYSLDAEGVEKGGAKKIFLVQLFSEHSYIRLSLISYSKKNHNYYLPNYN